ncbi:E3 ubiquitin-protein ligase Mdm2-like [Neocloeon triangulifer]|uniref:E3 ubiquitin-protein ligase Mdm2-like n=1 Tax=Neocloeon triangulifer TaxID=2078957 RepID=UPI00286F444C|nr:E3 ubiquitin-protein ligase Mdm2-like [Neocloeon triangulifer]XP_059489552.1 E3 ubiquitin-protein ligase Mdm2-like [Neocloeon triangulifer]XP_059489553.1 E3 ubiquitin-protein ligase Mdm2-like [Neocloeon triangulifer]
MSKVSLAVVPDLVRRKRGRHRSKDGHCIGGCGNPSCTAKRRGDIDENVRWWYIKLESESEPFDSDEPDSLKNESLWSIQLRDTDSVHDSSDSESRWRQAHDIEYEVASLNSESEIKPFSCSSDDDSCSSVEGLVIATVAPDGITIDYFADSSSDSDSSDSSDPELQPQDKWSCLRCKQKNQPIPRYCQHCFAVRKKWFPPRPKGHKKRQEANLESLTIPPQIQITPNLSIPDLSQMKGHPIADSIERSFSESVSRFASMTENERLEQLKENLHRNKLAQSHTEQQVTECLTKKVKEELKSTLINSLEEQQQAILKNILDVKEIKKRTRVTVMAKSTSSECSFKTIEKDCKPNKMEKRRSALESEEVDFRTKVSEYLASCSPTMLDTPPMSQETNFSLTTSDFDDDVADGPICRLNELPASKEPVEEGRPFSFSTISGNGIKMCAFCEVKEANTAFIHARKGHLCACYICAKQVYAAKGQCPICQRQASSVCKIYS